MTSNPKLSSFRSKKVWHFLYRGIYAEINNWETENSYDGKKSNWTYYIFLNLNQFTDIKLAKKLWIKAKAYNPKSEKTWERRKHCDYFKISFLSSLSFHGGITFYAKSFSRSDEKMIQIGCDYGHVWDNPDYETVESVTNDVINTINDIHSKTEYLLMCQGNGNLVKESDGIYYNNSFYSLEYAKTTKWYINYLEEESKSTA